MMALKHIPVASDCNEPSEAAFIHRRELVERRMRLTIGVVVSALVMSVGAPPQASADDDATARSVFPVRVISAASDRHGSAVLIRREDHATDATLYFLTSSRLFHESGERRVPPRVVQVRLDDTRTLDVKREDVLFTGDAVVDLAIIRAITTDAEFLVPKPVVYEPPAVGAVFLLSGPDGSQGVTTVADHVRFESTLLVMGDRDASALVDCLGAPALSPEGVFGIVQECEPNRVAVISLLSMARPYIERYLPRVTTTQTVTVPQFRLVDRQVTGPLLTVGCNAATTGELDVPFTLGPRESVADVTAALTTSHEVPLADINVLKLEDRIVRLRFTLGGDPPPPVRPTDCPHGQALVTVHLRLAVMSRP